MATWEVILDLDDDLLFGDSGGNLASYLISFTATLGYTDADQHLAAGNRATLILDNSTDIFTPEGASPIGVHPARWIQVRAIVSGVTYVVFTGMIRSVKPDAVLPVCTVELAVHLVDAPNITLSKFVELWEFQPSTTTWEVPFLADCMQAELQIGLRSHRSGSSTDDQFLYWDEQGSWDHFRWGRRYGMNNNGFDKVGVDDGLEEADFRNVYAVPPTFARALEDLALSGWGDCFENEVGQIFLLTRKWLQLQSTLLTLTGDDLVAVDYRYGENIVNIAVVAILSRYVGGAGVLWTSTLAYKFRAGRTTERIFNFRDSAGNPVYTVNLSMTHSFTFSSRPTDVKFTARTGGFSLRVRNDTGSDITLDIGSTVSGEPLYRADDVIFETRDEWSVSRFGCRERRLLFPVYAEPDLAQDIAELIVEHQGEPRGEIRSITLHPISTTVETAMYKALLFKVIVVDLSDSVGHSATAKYGVVGITHQVDFRSGIQETKLLLRDVITY